MAIPATSSLRAEYPLHARQNFTVADHGQYYLFPSGSNLTIAPDQGVHLFPPDMTNDTVWLLGHPRRPLVALVFFSPTVTPRALVSDFQAALINVSLGITEGRFFPLEWVNGNALFAGYESPNSSFPFFSLWTIHANASPPVEKLFQFSYEAAPHQGPARPVLLPSACILNGNLVVWYPTGTLVYTNGSVSGTVFLADVRLAPMRWYYTPRLHCTQGAYAKVFVEAFDESGVRSVYVSPGKAAPCFADLDCVQFNFSMCDTTTHYCLLPGQSQAPTSTPPSLPSPLGLDLPPVAAPASACAGPPPSPQFFCNSTLGFYVINATLAPNNTVVINGSVTINSPVLIQPGVLLIVSQNFTVGCNASLTIGGALLVNGSAQFCGTLNLANVSSPPVAVGNCVSFDNTVITIDAQTLQARLNQSANFVAVVANFGCRLSETSPAVTVTGQSGCKTITAQPQYNDRSLALLFSAPECSGAPGADVFPVIAVAVGASVAGAVVLTAIILLAIPRTRRCIFPFMARRDGSPEDKEALT